MVGILNILGNNPLLILAILLGAGGIGLLIWALVSKSYDKKTVDAEQDIDGNQTVTRAVVDKEQAEWLGKGIMSPTKIIMSIAAVILIAVAIIIIAVL